MNNTLSTTLQILAILWLVRDVYAGESKRRPGKADFFFDDSLASSTLRPNPADNSALQRLLQSAWPKELKPPNNKSEGDDKPQNNLSILGNMGSLTDMWNLLQHVASLLNPLVTKPAERKGTPERNRKDVEGKFPRKGNLTGTTSAYGDIDLDEPFGTTIEYASGNDSYDDEDYEYSMNFSSPNPQTIITTQTLSNGSNVTPKYANQDTTEPNINDTATTSDPALNNDNRNYDVSKSPDITNEFIDDYINQPPSKVSDKDTNVTPSVLKNNETEPKTSTQSFLDSNASDGNDETLTTDSITPIISPENKSGTTLPSIQSQNKVSLPTGEINFTQMQGPGSEIGGTTTIIPAEDNPQRKAFVTTKSPDQSKKQENDSSTSPFLSTTTIPARKPLKLPNLTKKPNQKNNKAKVPTDKQRIEKKAVTGNPPLNLSPQEKNNNTKEIQLPQPNSANQIIYDKPSPLVNPYNNSFNNNLRPVGTTQPFNKPTLPTAQNQLNKDAENRPNDAKPLAPQNQVNKTGEPSENQLNNTKPMTPQNQLNKIGKPSENQASDTKPLTPRNQINEKGKPSKSQPNKQKPLTPQNQVNRNGKPSETQPKNAKLPIPENQVNKTEPSVTQPNFTNPLSPQNQTNAGKSPENNTEQSPLLTSHDQKHFAEFLDKFPSIKALLPKIANLPLLQMILGDNKTQSNSTLLENCTDSDLFTTTEDPAQNDLNVTVVLTPDGVTATPYNPENATSPTSEQQLKNDTSPTSEQQLKNVTSPTSEQQLKNVTSPTSEQQLKNVTSPTSEQQLKNVTSPTSEQQSVRTTTNPPVAIAPQVDPDDVHPDDTDNDSSQEHTSDENNEDPDDTEDKVDDISDNDSEDNTDDTDDTEENTDDTEENTDDTEENTDDADDKTDEEEDNTGDSTEDDENDNKHDDNEYNEEIDDLSIFDNSQEVSISPTSTSTQTPLVTTSQVPLVTSSKASQVTSSKASQVTSSKASLVTSSKTSQVTSSKSSLVTSSKTSQVTSSKVPLVTSSQVPLVNSSQVPLVNSSQVPLVNSSKVSLNTSFLQTKNCTKSPAIIKNASTPKPPKKYNSILEYLYDNSNMFASIKKQQNKTMS